MGNTALWRPPVLKKLYVFHKNITTNSSTIPVVTRINNLYLSPSINLKKHQNCVIFWLFMGGYGSVGPPLRLQYYFFLAKTSRPSSAIRVVARIKTPNLSYSMNLTIFFNFDFLFFRGGYGLVGTPPLFTKIYVFSQKHHKPSSTIPVVPGIKTIFIIFI